MASLHPQKAIALLEKQRERANLLLAEARYLSGDEHSAWQNTTRTFLEKAFGAEARQIGEFLAIANVKATIHSWKTHFSGILRTQLAYLVSCVQILEAETDDGGGKSFEATSTGMAAEEAVAGRGRYSGDPLTRRYQVFVSSTFEDLKEERKHVMHALLQTKCIPAGMELFPAANEEKWDLIKRVIDDCDYYVVIVAGRYGSRGPGGKSYTEMEFDYAQSTNKPVIGFYHENIDKLTGEKLEQDDEGRRKLKAFTTKVKAVQSCAPWRTPEGLESAIKSAMIHAIEFTPMPGWVRANSGPTKEAIAELKAVITREQQTADGRRAYPSGDQLVEVPVHILAYEPNDQWGAKSTSFDRVFQRSWDDLFAFLAPRLNQPKNRLALKKVFQNHLAEKARLLVTSCSPKEIGRVECQVETDHFERILQTFVARKLLKRVPPPKTVRLKDPYWQITPQGVQRLAEIQAMSPP